MRAPAWGGAEGEADSSLSRVWIPVPWDQDLSWRQMLNWLSHPGAHLGKFLNARLILTLSCHWLALEKSAFCGRYYSYELKLALAVRNEGTKTHQELKFLSLSHSENLEVVRPGLMWGSICEGSGLLLSSCCLVSILQVTLWSTIAAEALAIKSTFQRAERVRGWRKAYPLPVKTLPISHWLTPSQMPRLPARGAGKCRLYARLTT